MEFCTDKESLRTLLATQRQEGKTIGLVPTMGNLHAGHMSLVNAAKSQCDFVISTIFVNPLQFGANEDLDTYPRTLDADLELLKQHGCSAVFAPAVEEMFGNDTTQQTSIHVPVVSENFCGSSRPGHFDGVATIVCKLFNLTSPDAAFFGLKDYQQFLVIRKLVKDLAIPIEIHGIETVREASGLAMSSRNNYLNEAEKDSAASIYASLRQTAEAIRSGDKDFDRLADQAKERMRSAGLKPDYFAICRADDLRLATSADTNLVVLAAAYIGSGRLIDNLRVVL